MGYHIQYNMPVIRMSDKYPQIPYRFCPECGEQLRGGNPYKQLCSSCGCSLYHSSSPCVGALPLDDRGNILLAMRGIEPFYGQWNTIGGFLEYGEDPLEALCREVIEETGVPCTITGFVSAHAETYGPGGPALLNLYFTVELKSCDVHPKDDVMHLEWFSLDALPRDIPFESDRKALTALKSRTGIS